MKFTLPLFKAGLNRLCVDDDGREQMTQPNSCYEGVPRLKSMDSTHFYEQRVRCETVVRRQHAENRGRSPDCRL
jgi:hypothetical protein